MHGSSSVRPHGLQPAAWIALPPWRSLCYTLKGLLGSSSSFLVAHIAEVLPTLSLPSACKQHIPFLSLPWQGLLLSKQDIAAFGYRKMKFLLKKDYIPLKSNQGQKLHSGGLDPWLSD